MEMLVAPKATKVTLSHFLYLSQRSLLHFLPNGNSSCRVIFIIHWFLNMAPSITPIITGTWLIPHKNTCCHNIFLFPSQIHFPLELRFSPMASGDIIALCGLNVKKISFSGRFVLNHNLNHPSLVGIRLCIASIAQMKDTISSFSDKNSEGQLDWNQHLTLPNSLLLHLVHVFLYSPIWQ